jgi:CHAT domain-containing protein
LTQEISPRGTSVLALGDPAYGRHSVLAPSAGASRGAGTGAERFIPLPGSGKEARAVGDVVLLGAEANEARLFREIAAQKRWRSVHLACHGRFNEVHPLYSLLAVSPAGKDDDGLITCHDLLWASVPADLVVLSACRTARGRVYRGEGILGLTRAFMYAGAPCVLCSLWNVDDDATFALMKEFYALWHPKDGSTGLDAATALRMAQEHVASHEAWKHPKYWAAWVLWGDPR